jgi:HK97 family phage major capsid protein
MSLVQIDAKLSTKRRQFTALADQRTAAYDAQDKASVVIDALQAKETLSADEQATLTAEIAKHQAARKEALEAQDKQNAVSREISELESDRASRQQHALTSTTQPLERETALEIPAGTTARVVNTPETNEQKDAALAALLKNAYLAKHQGVSLIAVCAGQIGEQFKHPALHAALTTSNNPALVPTNYSTRLIELLRAEEVISNLKGVRRVPLENGNLTLSRQSSAASSSYSGQMTNIAVSELGTDAIVLSAKKQTSIVVQSGELMRRSSPDSDALVRDDLIAVTALKRDLTFIRSAGSATDPKGLKAFADVGTLGVVASDQANTIASITRDLGRLLLKLRNANVPRRAPVFILSPRSEQFLMDLRDGNGNAAFPEMERGMLRRTPYVVTTQIPENLTVSATTLCTEVYCVEATEILIGTTKTFELQVSTEAAYHDGTAVQAAYSQDAAVFRLITENDMQLRHNASVAYLERVTWGKE